MKLFPHRFRLYHMRETSSPYPSQYPVRSRRRAQTAGIPAVRGWENPPGQPKGAGRRYVPASSPAAYRSGTFARRSRRPDWAPLILGLVLLAGLLSLPFLAAGSFFAYYQMSGRILPGVHAGGSRLGGLTLDEAAIQIHQDWNLQKRIRVSDGNTSIEVPPGTLGLSVDPLATVETAYQVGHGQQVVAEMDQMVHSLTKGWGILPVVRFDPQAAAGGLQELSAQISRPARNASVRLEGERLVAIPAENGFTIDYEQTLAAIAADPAGILVNGVIQVALQPVVPAVSDVAPILAEGERLLSSPGSVRAYDPITNEWFEWTPSRQLVASWLVAAEDASGNPKLSLDEAKLSAYLDELSASLGSGRWLDDVSRQGSPGDGFLGGNPAALIVRHPDTPYTVEPGDTLIKIGWKVGMPYWRILDANPGLDPDALYTGQVLTVPSKDQLLPLPVVPSKRIVISISQQRLWTYQDGALRTEHVISTGIDRSPTQPGIFQIQTHEVNAYASVWDLYMPHFMGIYEAWPGFMNGIHGLPTLSNGTRLWANILGRPASYGCIILDLAAAEDLFNWAEEGVVVEIQP